MKGILALLLIVCSLISLSPLRVHACMPLLPGSSGVASQERVISYDIELSQSVTPFTTNSTTVSPGNCKLYTTVTIVVSIYYLVPFVTLIAILTILISRIVAQKYVRKLVSTQKQANNKK